MDRNDSVMRPAGDVPDNWETAIWKALGVKQDTIAEWLVKREADKSHLSLLEGRDVGAGYDPMAKELLRAYKPAGAVEKAIDKFNAGVELATAAGGIGEANPHFGTPEARMSVGNRRGPNAEKYTPFTSDKELTHKQAVGGLDRQIAKARASEAAGEAGAGNLLQSLILLKREIKAKHTKNEKHVPEGSVAASDFRPNDIAFGVKQHIPPANNRQPTADEMTLITAFGQLFDTDGVVKNYQIPVPKTGETAQIERKVRATGLAREAQLDASLEPPRNVGGRPALSILQREPANPRERRAILLAMRTMQLDIQRKMATQKGDEWRQSNDKLKAINARHKQLLEQ